MIGPARRPERACPGHRASACPVLRNTCPGTTHPRWIWASGRQSCPRPRPLTSARGRPRAGPRPPCEMTSLVSPLKPLSALVPRGVEESRCPPFLRTKTPLPTWPSRCPRTRLRGRKLRGQSGGSCAGRLIAGALWRAPEAAPQDPGLQAFGLRGTLLLWPWGRILDLC